MPELPDIATYLHALEPRVLGQPLERFRLASPFLVRSFEPPVKDAEGRVVRGLERLGKRIVFELDGNLFLVFHLMIAGRFRWKDHGAKVPKKYGLAALDFPTGTLMLTEAGTKRRASLFVVAGREGLAEHDRGGREVLGSRLEDFAAVLSRENHTLKRSLTDPRLFSGIGNAYGDEILHRARLSPVKWSTRLDPSEVARLHRCTIEVLEEWCRRLQDELGGKFPDKVTAFRDGMAVHGRHGQPCPGCGDPVQRIVHGDHETNYCARCQTGGKLLADRALSRLLKQDWPRSLEELEERRQRLLGEADEAEPPAPGPS